MLDRWDPTKMFDGALEECVYGSQLLGADPDLVLHGGGNTSVKVAGRDVLGRAIEVLHVKGSGHDLATITVEGFAALDQVRVAQLVGFDALSDTAMMNALRCMRLDASDPDPSIEAILHALIPRPAVQHTHADAILAITDTVDGGDRLRNLLGPTVLVVDYVMPGFALAKACAEHIRDLFTDDTRAIVLLKHGIFTFADSTPAAYQAMVEIVTSAEQYVARHRRPRATSAPVPDVARAELAGLRNLISAAAGCPLVMRRCTTTAALRFAHHSRLAELATRGPATPDHVLRTKRLPLLGRDVTAYEDQYVRYFRANANRSSTPLTMLDPAPRIVIDPAIGLLAAGRTARDADIALELYLHTINVIEDAEDLGGYRPVALQDCFDVEYWELEQAKLTRRGPAPARAGEIALVTGAASGIGRAIAEALLVNGAAVVGVDVAPAVATVAECPSYTSIVGDVRSPDTAERALDAAAAYFGGLDILVIAAGNFPSVACIADLDVNQLRTSMAVNFEGAVRFLNTAYPMLRCSPNGGRVVIVGSKNVQAPGPGAAAYSAGKAALNQVARIAALEWAPDKIRVNSVHPDGVFDTGLWTEQLVAQRAASYGVSVDAYKRRNLLGTEIASSDVAQIVLALCDTAFAKVTGAHIPIDGGNERVI